MNTFTIDIDCLYCPITREIYNEPVLAADGFIYEKEVLIRWFKNHNTSPKTNKVIEKIYLSCFDKKQEVNEYLLKYPEKKSDQYSIPDLGFGIIFNNEDSTIKITDLNSLIKSLGSSSIEFKEIFKNMISKAINVDSEIEHGWKLIHYICKESTPEIIRCIINVYLEKALGIECTTNDTIQKPIHLICEHSTPEMIKYIIDIYLDKGLNFDCSDKYDNKPIHLICKHSTPEMIKYIVGIYLDKELNLNCTNGYGYKPLCLICKHSTPEMIKYIVELYLEKNINLKDDDNGSGLLFLVRKYSTPEMESYICNILGIEFINNTIYL